MQVCSEENMRSILLGPSILAEIAATLLETLQVRAEEDHIITPSRVWLLGSLTG